MNNLREIGVSRRAGEQEVPRRTTPAEALSYAEMQRMLAELPGLFKTITKQNTALAKMLKEQSAIQAKPAPVSAVNEHWMQRLHDRMDALAVESRVTNYLLSEMVAIHKTMIDSNTDKLRDDIRNQAYTSVLNGE